MANLKELLHLESTNLADKSHLFMVAKLCLARAKCFEIKFVFMRCAVRF